MAAGRTPRSWAAGARHTRPGRSGPPSCPRTPARSGTSPTLRQHTPSFRAPSCLKCLLAAEHLPPCGSAHPGSDPFTPWDACLQGILLHAGSTCRFTTSCRPAARQVCTTSRRHQRTCRCLSVSECASGRKAILRNRLLSQLNFVHKGLSRVPWAQHTLEEQAAQSAWCNAQRIAACAMHAKGALRTPKA